MQAQAAGSLGWRALALVCCVVVAGCASGERAPGERMSGEHPEAGIAQTSAPVPSPLPNAEVPPQRPGKPAKAPLADPPRSAATETEDMDSEARSNSSPPTALSRAQADQVGSASWYGGKFHRRRTASGELFDMRALTAAHPTLPFGSFVCVRSTVNGRTVIVRINDRGPHTGKRVIDLSQAAAEELGMIGLGLKPVELFALQDGERDCPEP